MAKVISQSFPRLCAKQSSAFIKNELQVLQSKDNALPTRLMAAQAHTPHHTPTPAAFS